ncbi:MAG: DUF2867 domain-containing protein, partial [Phycisphaerae bacterium]|nr:DUF2867 domain-containing protein [Phycisphaerae bacterium]
LAAEDSEMAERQWARVQPPPPPHDGQGWISGRFGSRVVHSRVLRVPVSPEQAFAPIRRIGGKNGWYFGDFLLRARAAVDKIVGGPGMRQGRPAPEKLKIGDAIDYWRVAEFDPPRRLLLWAEMRVPGRAWLEYEVSPAAGGATICQTAVFDPFGVWGLAYWYLLYPLHLVIFRGMLHHLAHAAVDGVDQRED